MVYFCVECAIRERLHELSGSQALVLLCLASHMNDKRQAWPSYGCIAQETGLSRRHVIRAMAELTANGWIKTEPRGERTANRYTVKTELVHMNGSQGLVTKSNDLVTPCHQPSDKMSPDLVTPCHPEVDTIEEDTTEVDTKKNTYPPDFEAFWQVYPRKEAKRTALRAWNTKLKEKVTPEAMTTGAKHYGEYCKAVHRDYEKIKHPATFIGPDRHYEEWQEPRTAPKNGGKRECSREAEFDEAARLLGIEVTG